MSRLKILVTAVMISGAAAACGRNAGYETGSAQPVSAAATLAVANDYNLAMDIYVVANGNATRIGSVGPASHESFVVDAGLVRTGFVEIVAQPPGGGAIARTGSLPLHGGDVIDFNIASNPRFSTATIK